MSPLLRLGRPQALETAIELTTRLGDAAAAELVSIDSTPGSTTVRLSIPASGAVGVRRLKRQLWISFIERNVVRRGSFTAGVGARVAERRASVAAVAARSEEVRRFLDRRTAARPLI